MRTLCYTAFVVFWSIVGTLLAVHGLAGGDKSPAEVTVASYTMEEVAGHATLDDCWMMIEGKVYDITPYVDEHPTRPSVLAAWCGREATEGMRTKGKGRDHSGAAWEMLADYEIGVRAGN